GAAIQGAVLAGDQVQDIVLMDVTPLTLGVETLGDVMDVVIKRNTNIPTRESRIYSTASDMQTTVEVHVLQGERPRASQNKSLGRFHLTGIPPAPRGLPQIEVTFDLDANGILNVSAVDKATSKQQSITITGSGQLTDNDVQRMVQEADAHRSEDDRFKELAEARNHGDQVAYQLEKTLNELGDKVAAEEKTAIQGKIEALREATKGDDAAAIRAAIDAANQEFSRVSQRMYEAAGAGAGQPQEQAAEGTTGGPVGGGAAGGAAGGDDVIEGEFEAEDK
ncbi:Hsp70 family protein, partial [bacterium]|nr:Hsp70 family protein [bacterium]